MKYRNYPRFADDMRNLDNLANAYSTCETEFRNVWKQKWYEMVKLISKRVEDWEEQFDEVIH